MVYRVFVSHVNGDPETDAVLPGICAALEAAGCDVLVDTERLSPGGFWRQEIYAWLGLCHAAIVLISRQALDDPAKFWVARETALLVWRQALDPNLRLIPVLLPGVQPEELSAGRFADLQLREIQCLMAQPGSDETARLVINGLRPQAAAPATPLNQIAGQLAARLRGFDEATLVEASKPLALDLGRWRPAGDPRQELALGLLCSPLDQAASVLEFLAGYAGAAAQADLRQVAQILGANWVDPEAARWLAIDAPLGRGAVLNASTQFAAEAYVQRACGRPPPARWPVIPVTGVTGESAEVELRAEIEAALSRSIPLAPDAFGGDPAKRRRRLLEQRQRQGLPTFLLAQLPSHPPAFLRLLREAYPFAAALFLAGDLTEEEAAPLEGSCRVLRPMLAPEADLAAQTRMDDLMFRLAPEG